MVLSATDERVRVRIDYRRPDHERLPHVVKFSGGRSSAMMALTLAESGQLDPLRGDVVLFANTSAEHPATYDFAAQVSTELEQRYGVPVFWYEFCSVEDMATAGPFRAQYRRRASYRLVHKAPYPYSPDGYRSDGSVFEELLSFQQRLPDPRSRSCTSRLKLWPAHQLLDEWFDLDSSGPAHAGHYNDGHRYVTADDMTRQYKDRGGDQSAARFRRMVAVACAAEPNRQVQRWAAFTGAKTGRLRASVGRGLWDRENYHEYVALLGLRVDEARRVNRVLARTLIAEGASSPQCRVPNQPPGEHPYFPLHDSKISNSDVNAHWAIQDFDLGISSNVGNCTYCFMKGAPALSQIPVAVGEEMATNLQWWSEVEKRYRREVPARDPDRHGKVAKFGFLGIGLPSYAQIAAGNHRLTRRRRLPVKQNAIACDCTD